MNERDSEAAAAALIDAGFIMTDSEKNADILLFNTCSVRDQAERKAVGKIGIIKKLKKKKPEIIIGVLGCMAQSRKEELLKELPHIDFVLGTDQLFSLVSVIQSELKHREKIVRTEVSDALESLEAMEGHLRYFNNNENYNEKKPDDSCCAFISLMRGCNRFCAYCIVPYVRGREKSRKSPALIKEAKELVDSGIKEVMLLGQNVAAYGLKPGEKEIATGESPFADFLALLSEINGLERIRFTSPHPSCFNDKLIDAVASLPKVCKNIHLPLQSGSNKILKSMKRGYTTEEYLDIVEKLKQKIPEITFSTDIIVGFPGEEEEDFNATRDLMENVGFDNAFIFKYSPRRGTKAAEMEDSVTASAKAERNALLLTDLNARTSNHNRQLEGRIFEILVEGISKRNTERWLGRTTTNKVVVFTPYPEIMKGDMVNVLIEKSTSMTLFGKKL